MLFHEREKRLFLIEFLFIVENTAQIALILRGSFKHNY